MHESAERVVVLGRSGDAQQQLSRALQDIGVEPLAVGDFDQLDPGEIRAQQPTVFLVSMDERMDATSIDRWQDLFDDPGIRAVFDDADVSGRLSGWDLARWARHLAAKVLGRDDVLPPVDAAAERLGEPSARLVDPNGATVQGEPTDLSAPADELTFESDPTHWDPTNAEEDANRSAGDIHESGNDVTTFDISSDAAEVASDDAAFAELSAQFDAEQQRDRSHEAEVAPALEDLLRADADSEVIIINAAAVDSDEPSPQTAEKPAVSGSSGLDFELAPIDDVPAPSPEKPVAAPDVDIDVSGFALEPITAEATGESATTDTSGALAIVAGLGGPDAVRQVLAGLPASLPVPVLLWQHLDAGKHDRLAQQLGKASALPVYLARPGELARPGSVAVMTPAVGVEHDLDGWWFTQCDSGLRGALESALVQPNSFAIVLSGADGSVVSVASAHEQRGGQVRVQNPESCFDAASAATLQARGVAVASPTELAAMATAHWPSPAATE